MKSAVNKGKKRGSVFSELARKRSRDARISSSGVKQVSKKSTADDEGERTAIGEVVETSVPSKSSELKKINLDPSTLSKLETMDLMPVQKEWSCEKCTLTNPINRKRCEACKARKPIATSYSKLEPSDSPSTRLVYSTPEKVCPLHVKTDTSINVKLVKNSELPKTNQTKKSSMHTENELDNGGRREYRPSSPVDTDDNKDVRRNEEDGANSFQNESSLSGDSKESKPSNRDESVNAIENTQPLPAPRDHGTPISADEKYQQLQVNLANVLHELDTMKQLMYTQSNEIQGLRKQNEDILQSLRNNEKITSSSNLGGNVGRFHLAPVEAGESIKNDTPVSVSPQTSYANDGNVLTNVVVLGESKATPRGKNQPKVLKGGTQVDAPAFKTTLNTVNLDDLQCEENAKRRSILFNGEESNPTNLLLAPPSPALSSQTVDPDASSQMSIPTKVSFPEKSLSHRLLKNCTNQSFPKPAAWTTTKSSRKFLAEMDSTIPKVATAPWMTTRPKLTSTAPFRSVTDQNQDSFLDEPNYAYKETVRCHKDRKGLPCHDCDECRKWYLTLKNTGHEFSQDPLAFSRHRSRYQPHESPVDFWEMSFVDERKARQAEEAESKAREAEEVEK